MTPLEHTDLAEAMADLARSWTASEDHDAALQRITESAVAAIPGADSADIMTTEPGGKVHSQAPTSHFPTRIDRLQETCGQGPCLDAATDKVLVRADDLHTETRWPKFTAAARDAGLAAILSFQLYTHRTRTGALNVFATEAHAFDDEAVRIGEVFAAHAAIAITAHRTEAQLWSAVASRDTIGQAKGMLMERFHLDAERAFAMLVKLSQTSNTRVADVAARIVELGPDPH